MTLGLALLLGPGFVAADVQELDGKGANVPKPVTFAQELLELTGEATLKAIPVTNSHDAHKLVVSPRRAIERTESSIYLRLELGGGMTFSNGAGDLNWYAGVNPRGMMDEDGEAITTCTWDTDTSDAAGSTSDTAGGPADYTTAAFGVFNADGSMLSTVHSSGGVAGGTYVVFRLDPTRAIDWNADGTATSADDATDERGIPLNAMYDADSTEELEVNDSESCDLMGKVKIWVDVHDHLAIPAGAGSYTASITLHSNADQAQAGTSPSSAVSGMATVVRAVNALDVKVEANETPAVAQVSSTPQPFLWFANRATIAELGTAKADVGAGAAGSLDPKGEPANAAKLLGRGELSFTVEGDFSIGEFNLTAGAYDCPAKGTANSPSEGTLEASESGPASMRMLTGQDGGTYYLCVQTQVAGPNTTPIPAGNYNATITRGTGTLAKDLANGVIGVIKRNGATVNVTYLTVSEKYNQRLIIVNNGANEARYDIGPFVTEEGTTATPLAMASGMIAGGEKMVIPVENIVSFTSNDGRRHRAAATISLNADADDIQVATTQVNHLDGSTDTVVYNAEEG